MKKISAVVLALVMILSVLSLAGCGDNGSSAGKAKSIVGKWETEIDLASAVSEGLASENEELAGMFDGVDLVAKFSFEFTDDNKFTMTLDEDALVESFKGAKDAFTKFFEEYLGAMAESMGTGLDELLDAQGLTMDALIEQAMDEGVDSMKEGLAEASKTGTYKIDGQKLFMTEEGEDFDENDYVEFEFDGEDKIKFTKIVSNDDEDDEDGASELLEETLPWILTRK